MMYNWILGMNSKTFSSYLKWRVDIKAGYTEFTLTNTNKVFACKGRNPHNILILRSYLGLQ